MSRAEQVKQEVENLLEEFKKEGGKEALESAKEKLLPYFEQMASAKVTQMVGDELDKELAAIEIDALWNGVQDISQSLQERLENYAILKIENLVKDILFKHVIKAAIGAV